MGEVPIGPEGPAHWSPLFCIGPLGLRGNFGIRVRCLTAPAKVVSALQAYLYRVFALGYDNEWPLAKNFYYSSLNSYPTKTL